MLPIAYFSYWMDHTFFGIASYFAVFIALYVVLWAILYNVWKHRVKQINAEIKKANSQNEHNLHN